jgi:hypothetical protein
MASFNIPMPSQPLGFTFRYTLMTMPVGKETVTNYVVEMHDDTRSFTARASSLLSWQDAEHELFNGSQVRLALAGLRERYS